MRGAVGQHLRGLLCQAGAVGQAGQRVGCGGLGEVGGVQAQRGLGGAHAADAPTQRNGEHHHLGSYADLQAVGQQKWRIDHFPVDQHDTQHRQKQQRLTAQVPARGHETAPHDDDGCHNGQQRAGAGDDLVHGLGCGEAAQQAQQGRERGQQAYGQQQPIEPWHLPRVQETAREQRAKKQPEAGQHHMAPFLPPGPLAPQIVGRVAVEAGQRQQRKSALPDVEAIGGVPKDAGQREVVDQQRDQDAVADAVEQPFVLTPLQVFGGVPDRQPEDGCRFAQQPGIDGVGAGARQLQAQEVSFAAQGPCVEVLRQAGVHRWCQRPAGGVERAIKTHVFEGCGLCGQHPVAGECALL